MGSTTPYEIRYPEAGAPNNVPADMKNLADDVAATIAGQVADLTAEVPELDSIDADISASAPGDDKDAGSSDKAARADHVHEREDTAVALAGPADLTVFTEALATNAAATGTVHLDLSAAREFKLTMTGNCTFVFDNIPTTGSRVHTWVVRLIQDGTGSRLGTWPAAVKWGTQGVPVLSTTPGKSDYVVFRTDDAGTNIAGFISGEGY